MKLNVYSLPHDVIKNIKEIFLPTEAEALPHYPKFLLDRKIGLSETFSYVFCRHVNPKTIADIAVPDPQFRTHHIDCLTPIVELIGKKLEDINLAYYLIIPPRKQIYKHRDIEPYYSKVDRYQIYFDISEEQEILQKNNVATSNSLVNFDPSEEHAYINHSLTEPWRFIVFDVWK